MEETLNCLHCEEEFTTNSPLQIMTKLCEFCCDQGTYETIRELEEELRKAESKIRQLKAENEEKF